MIVAKLYNGIYKILANDTALLTYLGIYTTVDSATYKLAKAKHIQKRSKPTDIATNMPLVTFYTPPGRVEAGNNLVYCTPVIFDIYTKDNVELAQDITTRINNLLVEQINPLMGVESFTTKFVTSYESGVDLLNTYCFTLVIEMSVSLDN
jgi:hypothetical protein